MPLWKIAHLDQSCGGVLEEVGRGDDAIVLLVSSLIVKGRVPL